MRAKVEPPLIDLLKNRAYISRESKHFSLIQLAKGWNISFRTLHRYDSPEDREVSRIAAQRTNNSLKGRDGSKCQTCLETLIGHPRCHLCTILIHGEPDCSCGRCIDITHYDTLLDVL